MEEFKTQDPGSERSGIRTGTLNTVNHTSHQVLSSSVQPKNFGLVSDRSPVALGVVITIHVLCPGPFLMVTDDGWLQVGRSLSLVVTRGLCHDKEFFWLVGEPPTVQLIDPWKVGLSRSQSKSVTGYRVRLIPKRKGRTFESRSS